MFSDLVDKLLVFEDTWLAFVNDVAIDFADADEADVDVLCVGRDLVVEKVVTGTVTIEAAIVVAGTDEKARGGPISTDEEFMSRGSDDP